MKSPKTKVSGEKLRRVLYFHEEFYHSAKHNHYRERELPEIIESMFIMCTLQGGESFETALAEISENVYLDIKALTLNLWRADMLKSQRFWQHIEKEAEKRWPDLPRKHAHTHLLRVVTELATEFAEAEQKGSCSQWLKALQERILA